VTTAGRRLWRTRDGGLVPDGDPAAVTLAYAPGDELTDTDAQRLAPAPPTKQADKPSDKQADKPSDKQADKPSDKARR
jgi:hypothetical protein